jgi:hypothetical protein
MTFDDLVLSAEFDLLGHEILADRLCEDLLDNDLKPVGQTAFLLKLVGLPEDHGVRLSISLTL